MPVKGSNDQILAAQKKRGKGENFFGRNLQKKKGKTWSVQNSISAYKLNKFEIKTENLI